MTWRALPIAIVLSLAGSARAEPSLSSEMQFHFDGERDQGYAWMAFGTASLVGGGTLFVRGSALEQGLSYPLLGFGVIQAALGLYLLAATDDRLARLQREFQATPQVVRDRELARIRRTERALVILRIGELALCAAGTATAIGGAATKQDLATGFGVGLAVESAILWVLDSFHAHRAHRYVDALTNFRVSLAPAAGASLVMTVGGQF